MEEKFSSFKHSKTHFIFNINENPLSNEKHKFPQLSEGEAAPFFNISLKQEQLLSQLQCLKS